MKKYFTAGLAILLPAIFTVMIVNFLINFTTYPFLETTRALLESTGLFDTPFFVIQHPAMINFFCKVLILGFLFSITLLIGLIGKLFLVEMLFRFSDYLLHKLPFVNKVYKACTDVVHSLFSSSSNTFSKVVFVPFPSRDNLSIGLITREELEVKHSENATENLVSVFIPGTPNPSVGFILLFKKELLIDAKMKVDEAMKFIVSCGVVMPESQTFEINENDEKPVSSQNLILPREGQYNQDTPDLRQGPGSL